MGTGAKPTYFGRFLQKMPLDPDVGFLVMSGVRLKLVKERLAFEIFLVSLWDARNAMEQFFLGFVHRVNLCKQWRFDWEFKVHIQWGCNWSSFVSDFLFEPSDAHMMRCRLHLLLAGLRNSGGCTSTRRSFRGLNDHELAGCEKPLGGNLNSIWGGRYVTDI